VPARIAQAFAPWLFGVAIDRWGAQALWPSAAIGAVALVALLLLRAPANAQRSDAHEIAAASAETIVR
jgi:predicted MFS family arabinose efflux permease